MNDIPQNAIDAAALAIHQAREVGGHNHGRGPTDCARMTAMDVGLAKRALKAAEAVWPHTGREGHDHG